MLKARWLVTPLFCGLGAATALADDIRPEARALSDARPMADEKCIERCDTESDQCMQAADGDDGKVQVCDDKYSECLQKCEGG